MSAADRPISEAVLDRVCAAYAAIADDCMGLVRRKAMRAALAEYAAAAQQQQQEQVAPPSAPVKVKPLSEFMAEQEALHPGIRDKMQAAADELRAEIERLRGNVRPRREDECLTLNHWRMRAYDLERNWARCSHACAVEQAKREQAEARAEQLAEALRLALDSHGVMLMTDPPQDAWKARRVEEIGRALLRGQEEGK